MMKKMLLAASLVASTATPAYAVTFVTEAGSSSSFAGTAPAGAYLIDFNSGSVAAPFSLTGSLNSIVQGSLPLQYQEPLSSDGSKYLAVTTGGTAKLALSAGMASPLGFNSVSFFLGSIDTYNTIQILNKAGGVIASYTGSQLTAPNPATGSATNPVTNLRLTFTRDGSDASIGGVKILSSRNSAEVDNVIFAVPEPSTWMFMLAGFGIVGFAMRRRRKMNVVYG